MFTQLAPLTLTLLIVAIAFFATGWPIPGTVLASFAILNEIALWLAVGKGNDDGVPPM